MANEPEASGPVWLRRLRHELGPDPAWDQEEVRFLAADVRAAVVEIDRLRAVLREIAFDSHDDYKPGWSLARKALT